MDTTNQPEHGTAPEHVQILRYELRLQRLQLPRPSLELNLPLRHESLSSLVGIHPALNGLQELLPGGVVLVTQVNELCPYSLVVGLELVVLAAQGLLDVVPVRFEDERSVLEERPGARRKGNENA